MRRDEILAKMRTKPPMTKWKTMQLAQAGAAQLRKMEDAGLVSCWRRREGICVRPVEDWYLTKEQYEHRGQYAAGF